MSGVGGRVQGVCNRLVPAKIPLRTNPDGSIVRVKDIGRTQLGSEIPDMKFSFNGKPAAMMAIRQEAGANALDTADHIKSKMKELANYFPQGMKVVYPYDTTPFVNRQDQAAAHPSGGGLT